MGKRRTIYHNDARHYYLWLYDPPMRMRDAWRPVDDVAGTGVDTFSYCVSRGDGLFYPSKAGLVFGSDRQPFTNSISWHAWTCMQSLLERGHDPLALLIDRAHAKGMAFWADLRLASYGGIDPAVEVAGGGRYFAEESVREHLGAIARELTLDYAIDGLELDFAIANGSRQVYLRAEDVEAHTPTITAWVEGLADLVRSRAGGGVIGARVFPTEEINLRQGLDVRTWLDRGIVDFVTPLMYEYNRLDPNMPFDWLVEAAGAAGKSVYGMIHPTMPSQDMAVNADNRVYASIEHLRGAAASMWARGVDGLNAWFLRWPHGEAERAFLSEMGDPDLIEEKDRTYFVLRRSGEAGNLAYGAPLPLDIPAADPAIRYEIPFCVGEDIASNDRVRSAILSVKVMNHVAGDRLSLWLNGRSLDDEPVSRDFAHNTPHVAPRGVDLQYHLRGVAPRKGWNTLTLSLESRPDLMAGGVTVDQVELRVRYSPYPTTR